MNKEFKNNIISLDGLNKTVLSILFVRENITPSSMPLGRGFYFRSIHPKTSHLITSRLKQLREALIYTIKSLKLNFVIYNKSM